MYVIATNHFYDQFYHYYFFFFNDTATTAIYTLSLHDALPIFIKTRRTAPSPTSPSKLVALSAPTASRKPAWASLPRSEEHTSSSHTVTSYAVFCLKKKIQNSI